MRFASSARHRPAAIGRVLPLLVSVGNPTTRALESRIRLTLPPGVAFVDADPGDASVAAQMSWSAALEPAQAAEFRAWVRLPDSAAEVNLLAVAELMVDGAWQAVAQRELSLQVIAPAGLDQALASGRRLGRQQPELSSRRQRAGQSRAGR